MLPWLNHIFRFQYTIHRRQRSKELSGLMPVDEDMAYRLADKLRRPGSGFNRIAFMLKRFVPGSPGLYRLRVCPPAKFPGSNPENLAGAFLGKAESDSFVYDINHSSFDLLCEMAF